MAAISIRIYRAQDKRKSVFLRSSQPRRATPIRGKRGDKFSLTIITDSVKILIINIYDAPRDSSAYSHVFFDSIILLLAAPPLILPPPLFSLFPLLGRRNSLCTTVAAGLLLYSTQPLTPPRSPSSTRLQIKARRLFKRDKRE